MIGMFPMMMCVECAQKKEEVKKVVDTRMHLKMHENNWDVLCNAENGKTERKYTVNIAEVTCEDCKKRLALMKKIAGKFRFKKGDRVEIVRKYTDEEQKVCHLPKWSEYYDEEKGLNDNALIGLVAEVIDAPKSLWDTECAHECKYGRVKVDVRHLEPGRTSVVMMPASTLKKTKKALSPKIDDPKDYLGNYYVHLEHSSQKHECCGIKLFDGNHSRRNNDKLNLNDLSCPDCIKFINNYMKQMASHVFKIGDLVKLARKPTEKEIATMPTWWGKSKDECVGRIAKVEKANAYGVHTDMADHFYPSYLLVKATEKELAEQKRKQVISHHLGMLRHGKSQYDKLKKMVFESEKLERQLKGSRKSQNLALKKIEEMEKGGCRICCY